MIGLVDEYGLIDLETGSSVVFLILTLGVLLAFYLLRSFGLYAMAKGSEDKKINKISYVSFIPFAWVYVAGKLAGNISVFGFRIKNYALIILIVFATAGVLDLVINIWLYYPVIGGFFQGETVYINMFGISSSFTNYSSDLFILAEPTTAIPESVYNFLYISSYVVSILKYIAEIAMIFIYIELFRRYWPRHVFAGSIFSIFGLFPIFVFAVRKHKPVNYTDYIYSQYRNVYNSQNYNQNNNNYNNGKDDPFSDYSNGNDNYVRPTPKNNNDEDPFADFDKKN